jgi:hypothetical protein
VNPDGLSDSDRTEILLINAEVDPNRREIGDNKGFFLSVDRLAAR